MRSRWPSILLALALTFGVTVDADAQARGLRHLKAWAGELPVRGRGERRRNIFGDARLRAALVGLMGADEFARMVERFETTAPADLIDGYLILTGWPTHHADRAYFVAVNLSSGEVWAARRGEQGARWFGGRVPRGLPACLIEDFRP